MIRVFISSVQKEFAEERKALAKEKRGPAAVCKESAALLPNNGGEVRCVPHYR